MDAPPVQYVKTNDGYDIAYAVSGGGPPLVLLPNPNNHFQLMWQEPAFRSLFVPLANRFRLVQFDGRGEGLSSRGLPEGFSVFDRCRDLEAVVDKLGLDQFVLVGTYFAHVAVRYCLRFPEKVHALILCGGESEEPTSGIAPYEAVARTNWDLFVETLVRMFPTGQPRTTDWFKKAVTQADFLRTLEGGRGAIVTPDLASVSVPTLVTAQRSDIQPFEAIATRTTAAIPGAHLVLFEGSDNGMYTEDGRLPSIVPVIENFLGSLPSRPAAVPSAGARAGLSAREVEVLRLLAAGKSNAQIAEALIISQNTVIRHVSNIFAKIGVANRALATAYAKDHGIA